MSRLLSANLRRLKINIPFYIYSFLIFAISILFTSKLYILMFGEYLPVEDAIMIASALPAGFNALFIGFFLGREYSDKTIRNKIVVGFTKSEIYGASLITTSLVTTLWVILWFVGCISGATIAGAEYSMESLIVKAFVVLFFNLAFSSGLTAVSMMVHSRVLCIVLHTQVPPYLITFALINGSLIGTEGAFPPVIKEIMTFVVNLMPMGQWFFTSVDYGEVLYPNPVLMLLSVGVIVLFTAVGIRYFKEKEIK
ncbi:MAG: hypothetical protein J6B08_05940 [Ruminiclostridium sp.]|nr:hypothetical protein [Ruminiclostridium sp.]